MKRLPSWLRTPLCTVRAYGTVHALTADLRLGTVCRSAHCPNRLECWNEGAATFMVLGAVCTRDCRFCAVPTAVPGPPDPDEPVRLADAVRRLGLRFAVITMVTRDDLPDGGSEHMAACVRAVRAACPETGIEVLASDFGGDRAALDLLLDARPEVFAHNLETVRRLQAQVRSRASHACSLGVLRHAADRPGGPVVKSGLMLGMGETDAERREAMRDLRDSGCRLLTLGQYLAPGPEYWPVAEFVTPGAFDGYGQLARELGFEGVAFCPRVRSSYRAGNLYAEALEREAAQRQ